MRLATAVLLLSLGAYAIPCGAADLARIDRHIVKEPKYTTEPSYVLFVFGKEAEKRVWVVIDGDAAYVDRNGNGDLTEPGERVELGPDGFNGIDGKPGTGLYRGTNSFELGEIGGWVMTLDVLVRNDGYVPQAEYEKARLKEHREHGWEYATLRRLRKGHFFDWYDLLNSVTLCRRPQDAQVWHFDGPLTFALRSDKASLKLGSDDNVLRVIIGTPGLPARDSAEPVFAQIGTSDVPSRLHPVARVEFPGEDVKGPVPELEAVLSERCCGDCFYGLVEVPAGAGTGKAKVTLTFGKWQAGNVTPATIEVAVRDAAPTR